MDIEIKLSFNEAEDIAKAIDAKREKGFRYDLDKTEASMQGIIIRGSFSGEMSELIDAFSKSIKIKTES